MHILFWIGVSMMGIAILFQFIRLFFHVKYHTIKFSDGLTDYKIHFDRINSILWTVAFRKYVYFSNIKEAIRINELARLNGRV